MPGNVNDTREEAHIQEFGYLLYNDLIPEGQKSIKIEVEGYGVTRFNDIIGSTADMLPDGTYEVRDKDGRLYLPTKSVARDDDKHLPTVIDSAIAYHDRTGKLGQYDMEKYLRTQFNGNIKCYLTDIRWVALRADLQAKTNKKKYENCLLRMFTL